MNTSPLFPPDLIHRIAELAREVPRHDDLRALLSVCFYAGIRQEEGRPLAFRLGYVPQHHGEYPKVNPSWTEYRFKEPLPFDISEVSKLALATDPTQTTIAVWPSGGALRIWGLIREGRGMHRLHRQEQNTAVSLGEPFISLQAIRPGDFDIRVGINSIARFRAGRLEDSPFTVLYDDGLVLDFLARCAPSTNAIHVPEGERDRTTKHHLAEFLRHTLRRVVELGHGGTLVITEGLKGSRLLADDVKFRIEMNPGAVCSFIKSRHQLDSAAGMVQPTRSDSPDPNADDYDGKIQAVLDAGAGRLHYWDTVEQVARLTQVDGAVALNARLDVIAFGVRFALADVPPTVISARDLAGTPGQSYELDSRGTRHRSAAQCAADSGALVFCVSQDGGCSAFLRHTENNDRRVLAWSPVAVETSSN